MNSYHKISIICPAFNHEKYVGYFIKSIIDQTIKDFELVIIDDCSSDNTVSEIKKFNDSRIKLIQHEWNKGFVVAWEDAIRIANGDIICTCASDDILEPNYLEEVLKAFNEEEGLDVFYSSYVRIDENNNEMKNSFFELDSKISKYEILKKSFIAENQLPSPGMAYKKSSIEKILPFHCGLLQYIDWQIHNKMLLLNSNIKCSDKLLVKYRVLSSSASARNYNVLKRESCETFSIMDPFLNIKNLDVFKKIFEGLYNEFGEPIVETIPYFLARIAMKSKFPDKQRWGYETLLKIIAQRDNYEKLHKLYGFNFKELINTIEFCDFINRKLEYKYRKYKKLYNIFLALFIIIVGVFLVFLLKGVI